MALRRQSLSNRETGLKNSLFLEQSLTVGLLLEWHEYQPESFWKNNLECAFMARAGLRYSLHI